MYDTTTGRTTERTALITGATRGLGLALARGLAARGWNLIIDGRDAERLRAVRNELAAVTHVAAIAGDVTDPAHQRALAVLARGHAGLDAVINNAGTLGASPLPRLLDYSLDELVEVYVTNAVAPLGVLQAVRRELKPGARIVNVTSDAAVSAYPGWGGYGSSKAALEQLSWCSPPSSRPSGPTCGCTRSIRGTCAPTCTRRRSRARTSATARSRRRASRASSRSSRATCRAGATRPRSSRCPRPRRWRREGGDALRTGRRRGGSMPRAAP